MTSSANMHTVDVPPARRRRDQGRVAMADDEEVLETTEPDAGADDQYVFVEADQPVWDNIGGVD